MQDIITTINQDWSLITAVVAVVASSVTWIISQGYANKDQDKDIKSTIDSCMSLSKRICSLESGEIEFGKYQSFAKDNRERIEMLERSDRIRAENLSLINIKLAGIETDCKWLRSTLTRGTKQYDEQNNGRR
jgi:hypothetical protein